MNRFLQIDGEGQFHFQGLVIKDEQIIGELFSSLHYDDLGRLKVCHQGIEAFVEAYDFPLMVHGVDIEKQELVLGGGFRESFKLEDLRLDEWDRFCGLSLRGLAFLFLRKAQNQFFQCLYSFDDTSISVTKNKKITIQNWMSSQSQVHKPSFWKEIYEKKELPPWDLEEPSLALKHFWPKLKMTKSRILVSGCGRGHDASFLASLGHHVTALDFNEEALKEAKKLYSSPHLLWEREDIFKYKKKESFDVIFDHTLFCAIDPSQRDELIKKYKTLLDERGLLVAVFFVKIKEGGPPYGASEWEIHKRLEKTFRPLHWVRFRQSKERRLGSELFVTALKI